MARRTAQPRSDLPLRSGTIRLVDGVEGRCELLLEAGELKNAKNKDNQTQGDGLDGAEDDVHNGNGDGVWEGMTRVHSLQFVGCSQLPGIT